MTNEQVRNLKAGSVVRQFVNGRTHDHQLVHVGRVIVCDNPRSGSHGHLARIVTWTSGTGNGEISTGLHSDEYDTGAGYPSFQNGTRVRGWELLS